MLNLYKIKFSSLIVNIIAELSLYLENSHLQIQF